MPVVALAAPQAHLPLFDPDLRRRLWIVAAHLSGRRGVSVFWLYKSTMRWCSPSEAILPTPRLRGLGHCFDEGERWFLEQIDALVAAAGFDTFLPHRENPPKDESTARLIFENDNSAIDRCDVIVANLNGPVTEEGTAWELGYAYANGKYLIGLHTDWRRRNPEDVGSCSLTA